MVNNDVVRVSATDTTEGTKRRNAEIDAEAAAREKAEIEYYRSMMDSNNQSEEAMSFRDGPIQSLTPDVVEMIALGKPTEWALKAAGKYVVKPVVKKATKPITKLLNKNKKHIPQWEPDTALMERAEAREAFENESNVSDGIWLAEHDTKVGTERAIAERRVRLNEPYVDIDKVIKTVSPKQTIPGERPLVAARLGTDGGTTGHPSFMVIPADDPMRAAHYLQKWAQHGVANGGTDITLVPLSSVSPAADARNILFTGDAYTKSLPELFDEIYGKYAFRTMSDKALRSMKGRVKTDGSQVTRKDVEMQVQRRASDMVNRAVSPGSPQTYRPDIPNLERLGDINEITRKKIYDRFKKTGAYAEAKPARVLSKEERFTIQPSKGLYDPNTGYFILNNGDPRTEDLANAIMRFRQDAKGGESADIRAATNGGDTSSGASSVFPIGAGGRVTKGSRIVINPSTFRNGKDALCVAFNERFRIWMEERGFNPTSEPTDAQRKFFRDTAYADDEVQLRRTILARIATLDTSVSDPTDDQMAETLEMLEAFKGTEEPQNDWERNALDRLINLVRSVKPSRQAAAPKNGPANATAGETDENPVAQETPAEPVLEQAFEHDASGNPITGSEPVVEQAVEVTPEELTADKAASEGATAEATPVALAEPAAKEPAAPAAPAEAPAAPAQPAAPAAEATEEKKFGIGARSGVWTGGKEGEGRELTGAEAQFAANREANAKPVVSYGGNDTQGNPIVGGQKDEGAVAELVPKNPQAAADANAAPIAPPAPAKPAEDDKKGKKKKK